MPRGSYLPVLEVELANRSALDFFLNWTFPHTYSWGMMASEDTARLPQGSDPVVYISSATEKGSPGRKLPPYPPPFVDPSQGMPSRDAGISVSWAH